MLAAWRDFGAALAVAQGLGEGASLPRRGLFSPSAYRGRYSLGLLSAGLV